MSVQDILRHKRMSKASSDGWMGTVYIKFIYQLKKYINMYVYVNSILKQIHDKLLHTWPDLCYQWTWANNNDTYKSWTWTSWIFLKDRKRTYLTNYDSDVLPNLWCYHLLIPRRVKLGRAGNTWQRQEQLMVPRKYGRYVILYAVLWQHRPHVHRMFMYILCM